MSSLIKSNGLLCTIIFPICEKEDGPPFAVSFEIYQSLLESRGFISERLELLSVEKSHPGRGGEINSDGTKCPSSGLGLWRKI